MITKVIELLIALFSAIPAIIKLFKKKPSIDEEKVKKEARKKIDDFKKTGRPSK